MSRIERKVFSVTKVTRFIRSMLKSEYVLNHISIAGELSNVNYHLASGHIYFTLKDDTCAMKCMMFASDRSKGLSFQMEDGQSVIVTGRVDVFERDGVYQLYAARVELAGAGEWNERFERLKQKLNEEGLFDFEHKKPIPRYAGRIGIVTAEGGKALHDIASTARRRNPYVKLYLYPAKVQGEGAALTIAEGIRTLDRMGLDVIIVGRGGGSIEDLWAFNEEVVAYAIYEANTPIISGTGHEPDTTIADYVADKRAATPTGAAELAVFEWDSFEDMLFQRRNQLNRLLKQKTTLIRERIRRMSEALEHNSPENQLQEKRQILARQSEELLSLIRWQLEGVAEQCSNREQALQMLLQQKLMNRKHRLEIQMAKLHGLSPTAKLINGFGYLSKDGGSIKDITKLAKGDVVTITVQQGQRDAKLL